MNLEVRIVKLKFLSSDLKMSQSYFPDRLKFSHPTPLENNQWNDVSDTAIIEITSSDTSH